MNVSFRIPLPEKPCIRANTGPRNRPINGALILPQSFLRRLNIVAAGAFSRLRLRVL
jgi:hypothetical protein